VDGEEVVRELELLDHGELAVDLRPPGR
jgi:hypothetical protein